MGPEKKEFLIHSELISSQSNVLDRMMNGTFIEAQQGRAVLRDVDENTFTAVAEFMYTESYSLPRATILECEQSDASANLPDRKAKMENLKLKMRKKPWPEPANKHWLRFTKDEQYGAPSSPAPISNPSMEADYSQAFILHAKVFIFADCYNMECLAKVSLHKLHAILCGFRLSTERVPDIIALARFCYDKSAPEKLRDLVTSYFSCVVESTYEIASFQEFLRGNADFASDLVCAMACRLRNN